MTINLGYLFLFISAMFFAITTLQLKAGVIFRPFAPLYRDGEPLQYWICIVGGFALAAGVAGFGLKMILQ